MPINLSPVNLEFQLSLKAAAWDFPIRSLRGLFRWEEIPRPHFVTPFFRIGMDRFDVTQSFVSTVVQSKLVVARFSSLLTAQAGVSVQHLSEQGSLRGGISLVTRQGR